MCKHEGAVFLAIRERLGGKNTKNISKTKNDCKKESVEDMIAGLGEEELRNELSKILRIDERLRGEFRLKYGNKENSVECARELIRKSVYRADRRRYVEYQEVSVTDGADEVLDSIDDILENGDALEAVPLCIVVLEEMADLIQNYDDYTGDCSGAISDAVDRLSEAISQIGGEIDEEEAEKIFGVVHGLATGPSYEGLYDWEADLMYATVPLCRSKRVRKKMEAYLVSPRMSEDDTGFSYDYDRGWKQVLRLDMIIAFDGEAAADDYIERNLDNNDIREKAIEIALERKQFEKVVELCEGGEDLNEDRQGRLIEFKHYRFRAYEGSGNTEKQKELAKEFVLDGDFEYYDKLKGLYSESEWQKELNDILERTKQGTIYSRYGGEGIYVKIIVAEGLNERLLDFCKEHVKAITKYSPILLPLFPDYVEEIFKRHIYGSAEVAGGRDQYREVCRVILQYEKNFDKKATDIKDELAEKYRRRPAFKDELKRIR